MSTILVDGEFGWFDPGPLDPAQIEILSTNHRRLPSGTEARRLQGLQDAWDCPERGTVRRTAASERMKAARASNLIPQPPHSDERRQQTSERMKEVWAKRKEQLAILKTI